MRRRALCVNCLSDCTVDLEYVKKSLNVFDDKADHLLQLPVTSNYASRHTLCKKLVLKEDVAALYETSWELFKQGSSSRLDEW